MAELSAAQKEMLKDYMVKYDLKPDHFYSHKHYTIITRPGVDRIQAKAGISVEYQHIPEQCSKDHKYFLVKATGTLGDVTVSSYGEVSPENNKNAYPIAMAEKRAMARVVLKLAGLYADNVFSEDEAEDFKSSSPQNKTRAQYKK